MREILFLSARGALAALAALGVTVCKEGSVLAPPPEDPVDGVVAVFAGRITATDGSPVARAALQFVVACSAGTECMSFSWSTADENGRFVWRLQDDGEPHIAPAQVTVKPPIGQGYDIGMVQLYLQASFQPAPPPDTTALDITLPPNQSDSRRPLWVQYASFRARGLMADAEHVYLSSPGGVAAMDRGTGEYLWESGATGGLTGPPYTVVGGVVVETRGGSLRGLESATGRVLWTRTLIPGITLAASEPDRLLATDGATISAYEIRTGSTRWKAPMRAGGFISLGIGEDVACVERLIVSPDVAHVECWSLDNGEHLWSRVIGSPAWIAVTGGYVILPVGEDPRETGWMGLDARSGAILWKSELPSTDLAAVARQSARIYTCATGTDCFAVRAADGTIVWRRSYEGAIGPFVVTGDHLYAVQSGSVLVLDIDTGEVRERIDPDPLDPYGFCGAPTVSGDMVFVSSCPGYVYAFRIEP